MHRRSDPQSYHPDSAAEASDELLTLEVTLAGGGRYPTGALVGHSLVDLLRAAALPIKAECGGAGVCATCHVRVPDHWLDVLPPPSDEELAKLDEIPGADERSRLACQIVMAPHLDGLALEIQSDSVRAVDATLAMS